jgi:glutathione S-transferase
VSAGEASGSGSTGSATAALRLLGRNTSSNVQKVAWCLVELGLRYERENYGGAFAGNDQPAYLELNPNGLVPTLIDGDVVVWESNTITRYLCNRCAPTPLYPLDPGERSNVERWMDWQLSRIGEVFGPMYRALIREQRTAADVEPLRVKAAQLMAMLDSTLSSRSYLAGPGLTLADITLGPFAYRWFELPIARPGLPALRRWYEALQSRPAYREHVMVPMQ